MLLWATFLASTLKHARVSSSIDHLVNANSSAAEATVRRSSETAAALNALSASARWVVQHRFAGSTFGRLNQEP
jgi:hypothetical protein